MTIVENPIDVLIRWCFTAFIVYLPTIAIYRRYFHPLARFPGPVLASITYLYEYYFDISQEGQITFKLKELHERYGPVIRLSPDELHFNDPDFYDEIFNMTNAPIEKPFKHAFAFGPYDAALGTINHDLHRMRRGALGPFFSRRSVNELAPYLVPIIDSLCYRFENLADSGETIDLKYPYGALATDVLTEYCFSKCANRVLMSDFGQRFFDNIDSAVGFGLINVHLSWLLWPIFYLPDWLLRHVSPAMADMINDREALSEQVEDIRSGKDTSHETSNHRTIFHDLLDSNLPNTEKRRKRLRDEAFTLVAAGAGSMSHFLRTTTFYITSDHQVHAKLFQELQQVMPERLDTPVLADLEKLPYLTATILEGLRVGHSISHRILRSFPKKALKYGNYIVPPNTVVGMTSMLIHDDPNIFPDPCEFRPERWLGDDQHRKKLQRYLTPFSRGSRSCLGINLAWAEMYLILAIVLRRFTFDVTRADRRRDVDCNRDLLISMPSKESPGIVVTIARTSELVGN